MLGGMAPAGLEEFASKQRDRAAAGGVGLVLGARARARVCVCVCGVCFCVCVCVSLDFPLQQFFFNFLHTFHQTTPLLQ